VDKNEFDLRQAFVAYVDAVAGGVLKVRVGRQERRLTFNGSSLCATSERAPGVRCGVAGLGA